MARDPFSAHAFDSATLALLSAAFRSSWRNLESHITHSNREHVRNAIAEALVDLANAGANSERTLVAYATKQAHTTLRLAARVC
jgi:hypothetical protein